MKKRIIGLILVVATLFLALAGCAFNYEKADLTKYSTFDTAFNTAILNLVIDDADFGADAESRKEKLADTIAEELLGLIGDEDKKYAGVLEAHDNLYYCYFATLTEGEETHIFFMNSNKMNASSPLSIQLGLNSYEGSSNETDGFMEKLSAALIGKDIGGYIYDTSAISRVADGDIITVSCEYENSDGDTVVIDNLYITKEDELNEGAYKSLYAKLIADNARVGINLGDITADNGVTYKNVEVDSIVKDSAKIKAQAGDLVFVTYTKTIKFDDSWTTADIDAYVEANKSNGTLSTDSTSFTETQVSWKLMTVAAADTSTFIGNIAGMEVDTNKSHTVKEEIGGHADTSVTYSTKVNCIINTDATEDEFKAGGITFDYTLYSDDKDSDSTKLANTNGDKIQVNNKALTYHILPVCMKDVKAIDAETVVREFYSTLASTQTKEHDHTSEDHDHETEFVFSTLNDKEYKYTAADGTVTVLADLIENLEDAEAEDLIKLYGDLTTAEKTLSTELTDLTTAHSNLANEKDNDYTEARAAYDAALAEVTAAQKMVDTMIVNILAASKEGVTVKDALNDEGVNVLVADYNDYNYEQLKDEYIEAIKDSLAVAVYEAAKNHVTFGGDGKEELPKNVVKDAYNAILNSHKNTFYTATDSTTSETYYKKYDGDFDMYLISVYKSEDKSINNMTQVEEAIQEEAEQTVKDIMFIYILADNVADGSLKLTDDEKDEVEKEFDSYKQLYKYLLGSELETYTVEEQLHAAQFDKIMDYFLETVDGSEDSDGALEFKNIKYTVKPQE